ncbi:hypothetical protein C1925_20760 [Stenotrophomonas sp. SAU14A_NAIMI4_5]|uniref:hypothetical protein n=1 Tax=Stenotrophomonas sp. SAU14A_NAIMI4_5 TaxID=2072413 RepID=UPI000D542870|nr:hypothetical protein [Stenotrophomonas sp. SAU14A_NAIMI4_5]AWH51424.1 hypothetical protein C1925_20760 [Stenotrophomonas sp. SAU14A_NAIMI4_5]
MIRRMAVLVFAVLLADTATAATAQDHRCLTGGRNDSLHLLWRWLDDGSADVQYAGQRGRLPVQRVSQETTVLDEDRPSQFDSVWEERIEGRRNGRYPLTTQGARVYGFSYERVRDGRRTEFNEDVEAWQEDGCQWPGVEPLTVASSLLD